MYADPQQIAERRHDDEVKRRASQLDREQEDKDLVEIASTPAGRRHLWRLCGAAGVTPVAIAQPDPHQTYLKLGEVAQSWRLLQRLLKVAPNLYILAAQEAEAHVRTLDQRARNELARESAQ